jgi:protein arginine kinase activator
MKCEICGERDAVIHIQQIMGEKVLDFDLCEYCAKMKGIAADNDKIELSVSELLTNLVNLKPESLKTKKKLCPGCGMKYSLFQKEGKLGCNLCFDTFSRELSAFVEKVAGRVRHRGKYPASVQAFRNFIVEKENLKKKLSEALHKEDYESAAMIRDRLKEIENSSGAADV